MKNERAMRLLAAMGEIRDETVREALPPAGKDRSGIVKWVSVAAALLVCAGVIAAVTLGDFDFLHRDDTGTGTPTNAVVTESTDTTREPETSQPPESTRPVETTAAETTAAETGAQTPGAAFTPVTSLFSPIQYSGPILPLTALGDTEGLRVVRQLTLYTERVTSRETSFPEFLVTDSYIVENHSASEKTLTLIYPVITDCTSDFAAWPVIELRGSTDETVVPTVYAGAYVGTYVGGGVGDTHTLNPQDPHSYEEYEVLLADGSYRRGAFSRAEMGEEQVLDYRRYDLAVPEGGHSSAYQESVLAEQMTEACAAYRAQREKYYDFVPETFLFEALPEELLLRIAYHELRQYGSMGETPVDRWQTGVSDTLPEILREILVQTRVFYLAFEITIPADRYEVVFVQQDRPAAYDYRDLSLFRIDAVPALDTSLPFGKQTFIILDEEEYAVERTNASLQRQNGGASADMKEDWIYVDLYKKE